MPFFNYYDRQPALLVGFTNATNPNGMPATPMHSNDGQ